MTENAAPDLPTQARNIASLVKTAKHLVADGKAVDLSALERRVRTLHDAIKTAETKDAAFLKTTLAGIIADLDELTATLATRYEQLSSDFADDARRRAMTAYGNRAGRP